MSLSVSSLVPSLSIIACNTFPPHSSSSVLVLSSSSAFCAAFFAATLAANRYVDRLGNSGSSGCSGGGDSHLLLLLIQLLQTITTGKQHFYSRLSLIRELIELQLPAIRSLLSVTDIGLSCSSPLRY
jgi:hypothetical protein